MQRSAIERARHECFLVVRVGANDLGSRPAAAPFASPDLVVGPDDRPRVTVWNLGYKEASGVTTEFHAIPAGLPVTRENAQLIGLGNPAIIPPGQSVTIACTQVWRRLNHADLLIALVSHPELDPAPSLFDAAHDRHVGQMNYPWTGTFTGSIGTGGVKAVLEVKPSNQGLFRVKLFEELAGRVSSFPKCDRIMKPHQNTFRWMEVEQNQKVIYDLVMLGNDRLAFLATARPVERPDASPVQLAGELVRV